MKIIKSIVFILLAIIFVIFTNIKLQEDEDNKNAKILQNILIDYGTFSNYLHITGYGLKDYEKINYRSKYLHKLPWEVIANYYISKGYDIRYIKTHPHSGYYEAIKLKTN